MTTNNTFSNQKREGNNTFCNLTEQLKKGELKDGDYYVKTRQGIIIIDYFDVDEFSYDTNHYVEEVLAPVPSYEEWQELSKQRNKLIRDVKDLAYIQEENQRLKELLKECNETFFEIRLSLASGKINSVFDLSRQRENDIKEVLNVPNK